MKMMRKTHIKTTRRAMDTQQCMKMEELKHQAQRKQQERRNLIRNAFIHIAQIVEKKMKKRVLIGIHITLALKQGKYKHLPSLGYSFTDLRYLNRSISATQERCKKGKILSGAQQLPNKPLKLSLNNNQAQLIQSPLLFNLINLSLINQTAN